MAEEERRIEEKREQHQVRSYLWYWIIPLIASVIIIGILLLIKVVSEDFLGWGWLITIFLLSIGITQGIGFIVYYVRGKHAEIAETVPYITPEEADDRMVTMKRRDKHDPVNLRLYEGRRKIQAVMPAGSGVTATEIYVRKFRDNNPTHHTIWYGFMRMKQPDITSFISIDHEMSIDEEDAFISRWAERLAVTPTSVRETRIQRSSALTGQTEVETVREPVSTQVRKEDGDPEKEKLE